MLKNKFGMTKVLVLVLSVLMLVSLVACNKADGPSTDDMNSAIQSAIDAANAEAAAREAALASSIAAAEAEAAAREAALASSLKAEAEKAAADAAAKAEAEASKEASKLAAELAAAEAAASKAQADASKAAESAKQASIAASKAASEAAEAAKTTTGGNNPGALVDKSAVLAEYSKLKTEYTYTNEDMYKAADYAALVLLFDKASLDLNNAATVEAANAVLEALKVDVAAIRSVKIAAGEVAALINALGDIETEVFTTQIEKIAEAQKAYADLKVEYYEYLECSKKGVATENTDKIATKLGVNVADLAKADAKAEVLSDYAVAQLQAKMKALYNEYSGKISKFDTDDFADKATLENTITEAYYIYRVLSVVNGGDLSAADLPTDWEYELDSEGDVKLAVDGDKNPWGVAYAVGDKKYDAKKPTAYFTTEELVDTFILPTLDAEFAGHLDTLFDAFETGATALEGYNKTATFDIDVDLDDIVDALEDEFAALSFVNDYKGANTFDDAKNDAKIIVINAYIEAMGEYLEAAKIVAIENYADQIEALNEEIEEKIDEYMDQITDTDKADTIERLNAKIATQNAKIEANNAALVAYTANVNATVLPTYAEMQDVALKDSKDYKETWFDFTKFDAANYATEVADYLKDVLDTTIANNFAVEIKAEAGDDYDEDLAELIEAIVLDLENLRLRVSPYEDDEKGADIFKALRGTRSAYLEDDTYTYPNTAVFEEIVAIIDAAIAEIEGATTEGVADKKATVVTNDDDAKPYYFKDVNAYNYAVEKYEYAVEADSDISKVIDADEELVTNTATDYPVEYLITAAEQVSETVIKAYVKAYQDVNAKIVTISTLTDLAKNNKYEITHNDKAANYTAYDKIYAAHAGNAALQAELKSVADIYTGKVDSALTTFANAIAKRGDDKFETGTFYKNSNKKYDGSNITINTAKIEGWAARYNPVANIDAAMDKLVAEFEKNFFVAIADNENTLFTNEAAIDYTQSKVVLLWNAKLDAVELLKEEIDEYKNTYTPISITDPKYDVAMAGQVTVDYDAKLPYGEAQGLYVDINGAYANDQILTKPADVVAYEAAIDAIYADYSAKIMALTIQNDTKTTIKNGVGTKLCTDVQVKYDLAKAQTILNAYVAAVKGTETYIVTANNNRTETVVYDHADSVIFTQFNTIILKNTFGVTRPQVELEPVTTVNGTVTISNAFIGSEFTVTFTPASGYVLQTYTITAGDNTTLTKNADNDKKVTVAYNGHNDIDNSIVVTATFAKKVTVEDKSAEVDVDPSATETKKKPSVTVPSNWYVGQTGLRVRATAPNTAADAVNGLNVTSATVKFYKADKTTAVGTAITSTTYDVLTGEFVFADAVIPADAEYATIEVAMEFAPEYKVVLADKEENIKILSQNATVLSQGTDANSTEDDILWADGFAQVTAGGTYTVKIAVKTGYTYEGATFTVVSTEAKADCTVYTLSYTVPSVTNLVTVTLNSKAVSAQ